MRGNYLLKLQGKYTEAEPILTRATEVMEKAFGPEHPAVASGINNRAILLRKQVAVSKCFYSPSNHHK